VLTVEVLAAAEPKPERVEVQLRLAGGSGVITATVERNSMFTAPPRLRVSVPNDPTRFR
jgi:ribosome-associated translation inhibitor RaiA